MTRHRMVGVGAVAAVICAVAAVGVIEATTPLEVQSFPLAGGGTVKELLSADTVAVLFYDPSDAFACSQSLQELRRVPPRPTRQVALVLTRSPTVPEARQLRVRRLKIDGVLSPSWIRRQPRSREMLIVRGVATLTTLAPDIGRKSPLYRVLLNSGS